MKRTLLVLIAFLVLFSCTQEGEPPPLMVFEKNKLEVHITESIPRDSLMSLKKKLLSDHNVILDFEELAYNGKGKIKRIRIKAQSPNGESGSASSAQTLGIAPHVWLTMDFNEVAKVPFGIGAGEP